MRQSGFPDAADDLGLCDVENVSNRQPNSLDAAAQ
jgi:hypothetical protein